MRLQRLSIQFAFAIGLAIAAAPAWSQNRGTLEQQMACTPDVFRLCGPEIPDVGRITACLRQNTSQLSGPCRAVFEPAAEAPPQPVPRARANAQKPVSNRSRSTDKDL
jgi:hypothetical protein